MAWIKTDKICPKCRKENLYYRVVDDDYGHEDINYWCPHCMYQYWIDGIDS